jgi:hypothetical protein
MAEKRHGGVMKIGSEEHKQRFCDRSIASYEFAATESSVFLDDFSIRVLVEGCCVEHVRRKGTLDSYLLQPRFLPRLAALAMDDLRLGVRAPGSR